MDTLPNDLTILLTKHFHCIEDGLFFNSGYDPVKWVMYFLHKKDYCSLENICSRYDKRLVNILEYISSNLPNDNYYANNLVRHIKWTHENMSDILNNGDSDRVYKYYKNSKHDRSEYVHYSEVVKCMAIAVRDGDNKMYQFLLNFYNLDRNIFGQIMRSVFEKQYSSFTTLIDKLVDRDQCRERLGLFLDYLQIVIVLNDLKYIDYLVNKINIEKPELERLIEEAMLSNVDIEIITFLVDKWELKEPVEYKEPKTPLYYAYITGYMPFYKKVLSETPHEVAKFNICSLDRYSFTEMRNIEVLIDIFQHYPPSTRELYYTLIPLSKEAGRCDIFMYLSSLLPLHLLKANNHPTDFTDPRYKYR